MPSASSWWWGMIAAATRVLSRISTLIPLLQNSTVQIPRWCNPTQSKTLESDSCHFCGWVYTHTTNTANTQLTVAGDRSWIPITAIQSPWKIQSALWSNPFWTRIQSIWSRQWSALWWWLHWWMSWQSMGRYSWIHLSWRRRMWKVPNWHSWVE